SSDSSTHTTHALCISRSSHLSVFLFSTFFFFNDPATTEIYTLSLHDALPIWRRFSLRPREGRAEAVDAHRGRRDERALHARPARSEEHTSELQSHLNLVCRLLLEKKKKKHKEKHQQHSRVNKRYSDGTNTQTG